MISLHVILPHIKKYGGVRRYLEFSNALKNIDQEIDSNIWLIDYNTKYSWVTELNFQGQIHNIKDVHQFDFQKYNKNILICGDANSLQYMNLFEKKVDLRIINIIFPLNSGYAIGDYSNYININDGKTLIIGNSTGWNKNIASQSNYHTIPGAINLDMFKPVFSNIKNSNFTVLFMAKNRPWKGYDDFISLINTVKTTETEINFAYFDTQKHKVFNELGVSSYVNLPQHKMKQIYSSHDCFLSFEKLAGWQNTVAEAMACKLPVITTSAGTLDIAHHNKTALVLSDNINQKQRVEEALTYLFLLRKNKDLRQNLKERAYNQIQQYSWTEYAKKYRDLIYNYLFEKQEMEDLDYNQTEDLNYNKPESSEFLTQKEENVENKFNEQINTLTPEKQAIKDKAQELLAYYELYNPKKSLLFDKYEKFGAYHWNSEHDKPYHVYIHYLKKTMEAIVEFNNDQLKMVDVGGGDGFIAYNLKEYVKSIDIVDTNKTAINLAKEKLKDDSDKIHVYNQDFFNIDLSKYDILLLSQIIEHFEHPKTLIDYICKYKNDLQIIIISTPLAKSDGTMWDEKYHAQEFFPDDLLELIGPLSKEFIPSIAVIKPHNQILVLENKQKTINTYLSSLFFNDEFKPDISLLPDITNSIITMCSNDPKITYIDGFKEVK